MDAVVALMQLHGAALIMLAVSAAYYLRASPGTPLPRRILSASHGVASAAIYLLAVLVWVLGGPQSAYGTVYTACFALPALLVVACFFTFSGPGSTHWRQLLNVPAMLWALFIGTMAITGEWL